MLAQNNPARIVRVLDSRADFLRTLRNGPREKRELVDELEVSRSTVDRGLRELQNLGLVAYSPADGYTLTLCGRLLEEEYLKLYTRLDAIAGVHDVLRELPPDCPFDPVMAETADVVVATPTAPHLPGTYMSELIQQAEHLRCLARTHSYHGALDLFIDEVLNKGMQVEVVLQSDLYTYLQNTAPTQFERLCSADNYRAYQVDDLPYGLFVLEGESQVSGNLLVCGPDNHLKAVFSSEVPAAVQWCEAVYDTWQSRATAVCVD